MDCTDLPNQSSLCHLKISAQVLKGFFPTAVSGGIPAQNPYSYSHRIGAFFAAQGSLDHCLRLPTDRITSVSQHRTFKLRLNEIISNYSECLTLLSVGSALTRVTNSWCSRLFTLPTPFPTLPESGSRGDFGVHLSPSSSMGAPEGTGGDPLIPSSAMRAPSRPSRGGGSPLGESKRQQGDGTCGVAPPSWGERWFLGCTRFRRRPRWRPQSFQWNVNEVLFE